MNEKEEKWMPKKYPKEFKLMVVEEVNKLGSTSKVAKKYKLNFSVVYRWKKIFDEENSKISINKIDPQDIKDNKELKNNELEDLINENLYLKELVLRKEIEYQKLKDLIRGLI